MGRPAMLLMRGDAGRPVGLFRTLHEMAGRPAGEAEDCLCNMMLADCIVVAGRPARLLMRFCCLRLGCGASCRAFDAGHPAKFPRDVPVMMLGFVSGLGAGCLAGRSMGDVAQTSGHLLLPHVCVRAAKPVPNNAKSPLLINVSGSEGKAAVARW